MARVRVSTTVDGDLLERARVARQGASDAVLLDEALRALVARERRAEIDASYAAYDEHPLDEPDEWGDLASWSEAAAKSRRPSAREVVLKPGDDPIPRTSAINLDAV